MSSDCPKDCPECGAEGEFQYQVGGHRNKSGRRVPVSVDMFECPECGRRWCW